jgi:hypothetical protein
MEKRLTNRFFRVRMSKARSKHQVEARGASVPIRNGEKTGIGKGRFAEVGRGFSARSAGLQQKMLQTVTVFVERYRVSL